MHRSAASVRLLATASFLLTVEGFQPAAHVRSIAAHSWALPGLSTCGVHGAVSARESVGPLRMRMAASTTNQPAYQASTRDNRTAVDLWTRMKQAFLGIVAVVSVIPLPPRH